MKKKCIGTQLCGPQTCVPMFLFVILSFCHFVIFVIFVAKGVEGNACLCRAIVRKWTLDCPKVDTCVNRGDSFSDGYVSGAIFVRKKIVFFATKVSLSSYIIYRR